MHILLSFHNQSAISLLDSVVANILTKLITDVLQNLRFGYASVSFNTIHVYTCLTGFRLLH